MSRITIYTTTTCPYCHMEKEYLKSKNIRFESKVVDLDQAALEEMVKLSGNFAVPFTVIEQEGGQKEKILGFDKIRIDKALGI